MLVSIGRRVTLIHERDPEGREEKKRRSRRTREFPTRSTWKREESARRVRHVGHLTRGDLS